MLEGAAATEQADERTPPDAVAPAWHTAGVLLLLAGMVTFSLHMAGGSGVHPAGSRMRNYAVSITAEWLVVAFIGWGAWLKGASLRTLMSENSPGWRSVVRDLGLAAAFLVFSNVVLGIAASLLSRVMHPSSNEAIKSLLPQTGWEDAVFLVLSLTAGLCEEMIFRGYLQRQFAAWTKSVAAAIAVQGVLFGLGHAYQGWAHVILIAIYGCLFGLLARWRKSLRPGMMAHFLQDGVAGMVAARFIK